jgi:hypothetical protein
LSLLSVAAPLQPAQPILLCNGRQYEVTLHSIFTPQALFLHQCSAKMQERQKPGVRKAIWRKSVAAKPPWPGQLRPASAAPFRLRQDEANPSFSRRSRSFPSEFSCRAQNPREESALSLHHLAASRLPPKPNSQCDEQYSEIIAAASGTTLAVFLHECDWKVQEPRRNRLCSSIW